MSPSDLRRLAADAWAFRWRVELEAEQRFQQFARDLQKLDEPIGLIEMAKSAAEDEARHAVRCRDLAVRYGRAPESDPRLTLEDIAPPGWMGRPRLLYEIVATCCVAETQSSAVLLELLARAPGGELESVLRELSRDEVNHGRLGWAFISRYKGRPESHALGAVVPGMLKGNAGDALAPAPRDAEDDEKYFEFGILPPQRKKSLFIETAEAVIFPGLELSGVDTAPSRAWLAAMAAPH